MAGILSKSLGSWLIDHLLNEAENEAYERSVCSAPAPARSLNVKKREWQQLNQINGHGIAKVKLKPSHA
jgi:hypothetical protein